MQYQIDQSGKIEQTERHTVVACINGKKASVLLNRKEKRVLQKMFIDEEYKGHEALIYERVKIYLEQLGCKTKYHLVFGHVGRTSKAHNLAYQTARGKLKPTIFVNARQILGIVLGTKKDR